MPKSPDSNADTPVVEPVKVTLNEFCSRLSEAATRPELYGAFESVERRAGRLKDTAEAYRQRFDAFVNSPV